MKSPKLMVLSIDGVPYGMMERFMAEGVMPRMAELAGQCGMRMMRSVQPTVSSVAWASYMTGKNPGKHGIYGFIDRREGSYDLALPNGAMMQSENLWEILSRAGRRVFGMNVPTSYPPRRINGILIGGFLAPSLGKIAYPAEESSYLQSIGYQIDSDAQLARRDKQAMLGNLDITLARRAEAMFHYMDGDDWDFFHTHIMGSDRINHFLLEKLEQDDARFAPAFKEYYRKIDKVVGQVLDRLDDATPLLIFSDHGFCVIRQEVQLSRYLVETGWTVPAEKVVHPMSIDPQRSKAYCLIPGRIHINLQGREPQGIVPLAEYQQTREALAKELLALRDPQTNESVIRKVLMREEIYWPEGTQGRQQFTPQEVALSGGAFGRAADLVTVPYDGYDLKLGLAGTELFRKTELEGMHTYHDAFMVARNIELPQDNLEIIMVARAILERLGVEPPRDMDGTGAAITPDI